MISYGSKYASLFVDINFLKLLKKENIKKI